MAEQPGAHGEHPGGRLGVAAPAREAALDLLGRRWTLRILWELSHAPAGFRELRRRCERMSSSVLNQRLRELRDADIVMLKESGGYRLTEQGFALVDALAPLHSWAADWSKRL